MGTLHYNAITSLDGFVNDTSGGFGWAAPDAEVHAHINDAERGIGTYLLGRRMHEVMTFWDDPGDLSDEPAEMRDFAALWQQADKVVYSATLAGVTSPRTRLVNAFDAAEVAALLADSDRPVSIGGPGLAAAALRAGLVDEISVYAVPVVVGGGTRWLPGDLTLRLELRDAHRFSAGVTYARYEVRR